MATIKNYPLLGVTRIGADSDMPEGGLVAALNLCNDGAGLQMLEEPAMKGYLYDIPSDTDCLYIHDSNQSGVAARYIMLTTTTADNTTVRTLKWRVADDNTHTYHTIGTINGELKGITSVGNTLITDDETDGVRYWLWRANDTAYKDLGSRPPQIDLNFGLDSEFTCYPRYAPDDGKADANDSTLAEPLEVMATYEFPSKQYEFGWDADYDNAWVPPEQVVAAGTDGAQHIAQGVCDHTFRYLNTDKALLWRQEMAGLLLGHVNTFIAEKATNKNKFMFPFFVRYAYELFDGSLVCHSYPVLLVPNDKAPVFALDGEKGLNLNTNYNGGDRNVAISMRGRLYAFISDLRMMVETSQTFADELANWKDIVKGVNIYITPPIYTYDQAGDDIGWKSVDPYYGKDSWFDDIYGVGRGSQDTVWKRNNWRDAFTAFNANHKYCALSPDLTTVEPPYYVGTLPQKNEGEIKEALKNAGQFYKIFSLDFDTLTAGAISKDYNLSADVEIPDEPTQTSGKHYEGQLFIRDNCTIKAIAIANGVVSAMSTVTFGFDPDADADTTGTATEGTATATATPVFSPSGGVFRTAQYVTITCATADSEIYYIIDDSTQGEKDRMERGTLKTLATGEQMQDDWHSRDKLTSNARYVYNSRLDLGDIERVPHSPISPWVMWQRYNDTTAIGGTRAWTMVVYLHNGGTEQVAVGESGHNYAPFPMFVFYPDSSAYKAVLHFPVYVTHSGITELVSYVTYTIDLEPHPLLEGAYWCGDLFAGPAVPVTMEFASILPANYPTASGSIVGRNLIMTSEADNPFKFKPENDNSVGNGIVRAMCANTEALGASQFGEHPMYCFTNEGVWGMTVASSGAFAAVQPVTRDVITEGTLPIGTDNEVIFATPRGLLALSGTHARSLTDALTGYHTCSYNKISQVFDEVFEDRVGVTGLGSIVNMDTYWWQDSTLKLLYDYRHSRIYAHTDTSGISWVYNMKSKQWTQSVTRFKRALNSCPNAEIYKFETYNNGSITAGEVYTFDTDSHYEYGFAFTRGLRVGDLWYGKIREMVARGQFTPRSGEVSLALWGTRNLSTWGLVSSSAHDRITRRGGSSYRQMAAFVGIVPASPEEFVLTGLTALVEVEQTNKLR